MKVQLLATIVILSLTSFGFSQENTDVKEQVEKGNQIIENARKEIGIKDSIKSIYLSITSESIIKKLQITETSEISISLPDKILIVNTTATPVESKDTSILNGEKYKKFYEFVDLDGRRTITDATKSNNYDNAIKFAKDKGDTETAKKLEALQKNQPDPKKQFYRNLWVDLFPLILTHPFEKNTEFKYVGKAQASDTLANIVDGVNENGHALRLFFDSKTNYLLLMIEKYTFWDGDYETKYYYSNRERVNGLLIPRKLKVEHKFTPTGQAPRFSYSNIDIKEINLNPEFRKNMFDVN